MNDVEAGAILSAELARYRKRSFRELLILLKEIETFERSSPSGTIYQLEIQAVWDDSSQQTLRVMGAIDDKGLRVYRPLSDDFLMRPDGSFAGE
jgi:hypothetical protein